MTAHTRYQDNMSSDDSFEWSSDSSLKTRRKSKRKTKTNDSIIKTTIDGPIKKAKKPGRKPLAKVTVLPSDPKLKRKAQNRAAQRAFRERKEQFVNELQEQMRELQAAKDKREKELSKENARLKRENERLKEENYILKDAKYAFEFPHKRRASDKSQPAPLVSPPDEQQQHFNSYDVLSINSPLSNEEECGELSDCNHGGKDSSASDSTSSLSAATFDNVVSTTPDFSYIPTEETSDLFGAKDNLYLTTTDYRLPTSTADNDFSTSNEPLPQLFGNEIDLFGIDSPAPFNTTELDPLFSEQMQALVEQDTLLNCAPENEKPCKKKLLAILGKAKGANRRMYQIHNDVKSYCPDFNLDQLCEDLRRKITFDSNHILTDEDVDLYIECLQRSR